MGPSVQAFQAHVCTARHNAGDGLQGVVKRDAVQSSMREEVSNLLRQLGAMARHVAKGIASSLLDSGVKLLKAGHQTL